MTHAGLWIATGMLGTLLLTGCATNAAVAQPPVTLVQDGRSDYVIVLDDAATQAERFAARELAEHLEQITGARLPIRQTNDVPEHAIVLGVDAAASLGVEPGEGLGEDGFVIRTAGQRLVIAGPGKRGTLYGVYELLDNLGVRWWYPGHTHLPDLPTVTLEPIHDRQVPALEYRDIMYLESFSPQGRLWMARNRLNGLAWTDRDDNERLGGRYRVSGNLVHSYVHLMDESGHELTDDMWALVDGQRRPRRQPCLTSDATFQAILQGVRQRFDDDPELEFVVVGQMDNDDYCRCDQCAAIDEREGSNAGQVVHFANRVAEAIDAERPGARIATAAYGWSRKPPANLSLRENVILVIAPLELSFAHDLATSDIAPNAALRRDIELWDERSETMFIWHYSGNRDHYLLPNPDLTAFVPNARFYHEHGAIGIFVQGTHVGNATEFAPLRQWLWARALWDPQADGRALIEQFVRGYYGPAAEHVLAYIDLMHDVVQDEDIFIGRRVRLSAPFLRGQVIADAARHLHAARQAVAADPVFEPRVRHAHAPVLYLLAKRGPGTRLWSAVQQVYDELGETLDLAWIAAELRQTARDYDINRINDPDPIDPWLDWLDDYASRAAAGPVLPPELGDVDPADVRVVQANQFDMQPRWWAPAQGASDGWAAHVPQAGWHTRYHLNEHEDFQPGRRYRLYVRARADLEPDADGEVWEFGLHPGGHRAAATADQLADGQWHVFDLGPFQPQHNQAFWTALMRTPGVNSVAVDCLWLVAEQ